jgi:hypothetical protein
MHGNTQFVAAMIVVFNLMRDEGDFIAPLARPWALLSCDCSGTSSPGETSA